MTASAPYASSARLALKRSVGKFYSVRQNKLLGNLYRHLYKLWRHVPFSLAAPSAL